VEWHHERGGEAAGPVDTDALRALVARGDVTRETLVWRPGLEAWLPAGSQPELFPGEPGAAPAVPAAPAASAAPPALLDNTVRSVVSVVLLLGAVVLGLVALGAGVMDALATAALHRGEPLDADTVDRTATVIMAAGGLRALLYFTTAWPFIAWLRRARDNAEILGARDLKYSRGWVTGGWFVPFLNLVRPYQVVKDIWSGSAALDPSGTAHPATVIEAWWAFWLLMNFVANAAARLTRATDDTAQLLVGAWLSVASDVLWVLAALVAVRMITRMNALQALVARARGVSVPR